jgi:RimJ/RimL family protein N-acetyltransferase
MSDETATEEQFIDFKCPACGKEVSFPIGCAGLARECFNCAVPIVVPAEGEEARRIPLPHSTERLTLRRFRDQDWKGLLHLFADDDFYGVAPVKLDGEEQITRWLESDATVKLTTPGVPFFLAVQANEGEKVMGFLSLRFTDGEMLQAILYVAVHREFQRQGFGAEALTGALRFCFDGISLHRVQAFCDGENTAARQLFEKAGMRREAEFVRDHKVGEQWANTLAYAILRDEFGKTAGQ